MSLSVMPLLAAVFLLQAATAAIAADNFYLKYSVSEKSVTIVSAVTPCDSNTRVREVFLRWFKRGFETVLAGDPPLMIDWQDTPEGRAGRSGYDFGMGEAARYQKTKNGPGPSLHTISIPPF